MPPWQPEPGHGEFRNERRLSERQIALFEKWVATGMAEGDPEKTPPPPKFPDGWRLGTPDLVVEMDVRGPRRLHEQALNAIVHHPAVRSVSTGE